MRDYETTDLAGAAARARMDDMPDWPERPSLDELRAPSRAHAGARPGLPLSSEASADAGTPPGPASSQPGARSTAPAAPPAPSAGRQEPLF